MRECITSPVNGAEFARRGTDQFRYAEGKLADNAPEVRHNREQSRFEADVGEGVAVAEYERQGDTLVFTHTRVPVEGQGQGVGDELARAGLEYARRAGLRVQPKCRFIASWMRRHPEYDALRVE